MVATHTGRTRYQDQIRFKCRSKYYTLEGPGNLYLCQHFKITLRNVALLLLARFFFHPSRHVQMRGWRWMEIRWRRVRVAKMHWRYTVEFFPYIWLTRVSASLLMAPFFSMRKAGGPPTWDTAHSWWYGCKSGTITMATLDQTAQESWSITDHWPMGRYRSSCCGEYRTGRPASLRRTGWRKVRIR